MTKPPAKQSIGNRIAPLRFIAFGLLALLITPFAISATDWRVGAMIGFDSAAVIFLLSTIPLFRRGNAQSMREAAVRNDANRAILLAITGLVMLVVLVAVAAEITGESRIHPSIAMLIVATLVIAWLFSNLVYALHYAHLYYTAQPETGGDSGGLEIPHCEEPDYWDFVYFAFTLGMTFQTSDTEITASRIRRIATLHSLIAFAFNIGVLAFTINVLGG